MHVQIPHTFTQRFAIDRIKKGLVDVRPQLKDQVTIEEERWEGNTLHFAFTAQKKHVTGTVEIRETEFVVDAKLPLLWRMFEGKIEKAIMEQAQQLAK